MAGIEQRGAGETGTQAQATFIVRLRREPGTLAGEWRGEVEHVQSARLARFADQAVLVAFVWSQLAEAERQPPAPTAADEQLRQP
jgi:hypothetical protein